MSEEQPEEQSEEQCEEKQSYPLRQKIGYGAGTFLTLGVIDLLAHLGPTGLFIGGLAAYVAAKHGPPFIDQVRDAFPPPPSRLLQIEAPRRPGKRSFLDKALGRYPETPLPEAEQQAEIQQPGHTASALGQAQNEADESAMVVYSAKDPRLALCLAPDFLPDVNILLREGIFACGWPGSVKTDVLAAIIEQIMLIAEQVDPAGRGIPGVVFDKDGDLLSLLEVLPNGRIADQQHWFDAAEIIKHRLQVIVNLQAWPKDEERAAVIVYLVNDLIRYTGDQEQNKRLPCPVFLDEAQYWLPQERVSYLTGETQQQLIDTFNILLSTGRERGLTPFLFAQRIAQIDESAIGLGIQIFMRQVTDSDQRRCMDYIRADVIGAKKNLAHLSERQGIVCLPGGEQFLIQFDERQSTHLSHAPTVGKLARSSVQKELGPALQAAYDAYRPGMRHHKLAGYLGTTPASAAQLLKQLQARGYIDAAGNKTRAFSEGDPGEYSRAVGTQQRDDYSEHIQMPEEDEFEDGGDEERFGDERQPAYRQGFRYTSPGGLREQHAFSFPMNARPRMEGQLDAASLMRLAHDLVFHPDKILSGRVSVFGVPHSGKSNLIAKICEELGRLYVPFVLADTEDEYSQLVDERRTWLKNGYTAGSPSAFGEGATPPTHFIPVEKAGAYHFGRMVLEHGFQVVLNLESYESEDEAAQVMVEIVRGMRDWEQEQDPDDRVSCFFILEEAATWLPQNPKESRLTPQTLALIQTTMFNTVVRKGRKRGIGFIFANQRAADVDKRAMQSSWRFLMWQTEKNDLDVYEAMCPGINRAQVQQFAPGEAMVMGPGILLHTRLDKRRSPDCAKTPGLQSVRRRYQFGHGPRFHTQDLAEHLKATAALPKGASQPATAALSSAQQEQRTSMEEGDHRVVPFVHPAHQPKPNSEQQLAWGCAVLNYLNEKGGPWTETAVRKPRAELRDLALALGVWESGAAEIIGGGGRAKKIKDDVDLMPAPRVMELLRLATGTLASYQASTSLPAQQVES